MSADEGSSGGRSSDKRLRRPLPATQERLRKGELGNVLQEIVRKFAKR